MSELIKLRAIEQYYGFLCFKYEAKSNWLGCQREIRCLSHPFAVINESASQQGIAVFRSEFFFFELLDLSLAKPHSARMVPLAPTNVPLHLLLPSNFESGADRTRPGSA